MAETVAAGASPADARKWWLGELARRANTAGLELTDLAITPAQVARVAALVADGALNDALAREVIDAVLEGKGTPDEVVASRKLSVVSDDGALTAAVDAAIAANPEVAAKVREGKVAAVGPLVGAVMKATGGQADAARVRQLILARLTQYDRPGDRVHPTRRTPLFSAERTVVPASPTGSRIVVDQNGCHSDRSCPRRLRRPGSPPHRWTLVSPWQHRWNIGVVRKG